MKYNAILLEKFSPKYVKNNHWQYSGKFLIAINNDTDMIEITASQLDKPITIEPCCEIILDAVERDYNGRIYYNVRPKSSYEYMKFPQIIKKNHI